jgi:hypothetical protein
VLTTESLLLRRHRRGPATSVSPPHAVVDTTPSTRPSPVANAPRSPPSPAAGDPWDEGLFELRADRVPEVTTILVLLDARGEPLLPLTAVLRYLEIPQRLETGGIVLEWPPPHWRARLDLERGYIAADGEPIPIAEGELILKDDEIYLAAAPLQKLLETDVRVDWANLRIVLGPRPDLPVLLRLENEVRRRQLGGGQRRFSDGDDPSIAYSSASGGLAAGWQFAVGGSGGSMRSSARADLGTAILGGSLSVGSGVSTTAGTLDVARPFARYTRIFGPGSPVRQLRAGELMTDALVARSVDGVTISNDPFYTAGYFGEVMIEPIVPAGWEFELYQGGQLLGVSTPGESGAIPADLGYGANPVRVRMIGPAGQEQVQDLTYLVPTSQVPSGDWRYRAGAGRCRGAADCSLLSYGDLRYGINHRSTAGIGLEAATQSDTAGWMRPYALLNHSFRPDLRMELRGQWGSLAHATVHRHSQRRGWQASAGWNAGDRGSGTAQPHWYADGYASIVVGSHPQPIVARARVRGREAGTPDAWIASAASSVRGNHLRIGYESGFQQENVATLHASRRLRSIPGAIGRDLAVSSDVHVTGSGLRQMEIGLVGRPFTQTSLRTSLRWVERSRVPQLSISVTTRTPAAYVQAVANRGLGAGNWFASASGGVAYDRDHGGLARPLDTLGQTGVGGRVFIDEDGDGLLGEGDELLAGVPVVIGGSRATTDESGSFRHWGLLPHRVTAVGVDTINLPWPDLTPAGPAERVRAVPHRFSRVDVPLVRTRELVGRVEWSDGRGLAVGGVTIEAHRKAGGEIFQAVTFSDGEYYFLRLPPGQYRIQVAASALGALRAQAESQPVEVPAGGGGPVQAPGILLSRPETSSAGEP